METPEQPPETSPADDPTPAADPTLAAAPGPAGPVVAGEPDQEERVWALLAHVLTLVGSFVAPLVIWLVKKEDSPFVAEHALESLNFQITLIIATAVGMALTCVGIGVLLLTGLGIFALIVVLLATFRASEGKPYRYPATLRLVT